MLQQLVNGLSLGLVYAFVALGYALVFGLLRLLNFAHGEIFMLGGVLMWLAVAELGLPVPVGVGLSVVVTGFLGLLLWATCFLPVKRHEDHMTPALTSFAFGLAIAVLVIKFMGIEPRSLPVDLGRPVYSLGPVTLSNAQLILAGMLSIVFLSILYALRTRHGRAMRAMAERPDTAQLMGIPTQTLTATLFIVSSACGGLAGALTVIHIGVANPLLGITMGLKAVAVMVIGGIGNIGGTLVAGILLGLIEVATVEVASGTIGEALVWGLLMLILLFRPQGLLGQRLGA